MSGIPSLVHSTGASICWHLVCGARHLLIWLVFHMNLYCLAGFYVSEKVIHHLKSLALLYGVSFVVAIEDKILKELFKGPCSLDNSKVVLSEKRFTCWSVHAVFPPYISTNKKDIGHGAVPLLEI